jgi:hypothetical protein
MLMMSFRCKLVSISIVFFLTLSGSFALWCSAGEKLSDSSISNTDMTGQGTSLRVLWTVSSYHILKEATWGENEARAMLFKPLDISDTAIIFDGQACRDVVFTSETVDAAMYLRERYQVTSQSLGLEEKTIKVVKTNCRIPGFDEYARLRDRRLLVPMKGVLFIFTPAVNY